MKLKTVEQLRENVKTAKDRLTIAEQALAYRTCDLCFKPQDYILAACHSIHYCKNCLSTAGVPDAAPQVWFREPPHRIVSLDQATFSNRENTNPTQEP